MVNVTDEALVMQVVTFYFPRWAAGKEMGEDDGETLGGGEGKQIGGPQKGETNTATRTIQTFARYCGTFKEARNSRFAAAWDMKLKEEAIKQNALEEIEKERKLVKDTGDGSPIMSKGFDMDIIDGCFDEEMVDDEQVETVTLGTEV